MKIEEQIKEELIKDIRVRIFEECFPRIKQCLEELDEKQIWLKPNENSNSIGNLVLHVCGNIRQYVISGIGNQKDVRERSLEFSEAGPLQNEQLFKKIDLLLKDIDVVLSNIIPSDLLLMKKVQGFDMSVTSILVHITEHLSYHTGQIAYATKQLKNIDLKFYGDMDLDVRSSQ
jgi:uncharacterized damage-inducible protein DinB